MNASSTGFAVAGALVLLGGGLVVAGCDARNAEALPEWSPADHDNQETPAAGQVDTTKKRPGMPDLEKHGITDVVLAAWKSNCTRCHGVIGRGDGPDGRALRPPDFTNPNWQRVALDSEMRYTIQKGRGKMPSFSHIPDETIDGLVRLIRMLAPRDAAENSATAEGSSEAPPASAPAPSAPAASAPAPSTPGVEAAPSPGAPQKALPAPQPEKPPGHP